MLDIFIDLSATDLDEVGLARFLRDLSASSDLLRQGRTITVASHPSISKPDRKSEGPVLPDCEPAVAFAAALASAATKEWALAIIIGAWLPLNADLEALDASSGADPMIGTIQPRFSYNDEHGAACLPGNPAGSPTTIPRVALRFMPATMLTPELPSPLLVLTSQAVLATDPRQSGPTASCLAPLLVGLRRRGFRNLVDNRVVVALESAPKTVYPGPKLSQTSEAHPWQQDADAARASFHQLPEIRLESILSDAFVQNERPRLLLDCRGLQDAHNGTSQAILGFLKGFSELDPRFEITVTTHVAAARFHDLKKRFKDFRVDYDRPAGRYVASVLLNQPWRMDTLAELHGCAAFSLFCFLDTIAWDTLYTAPEGLDRTWRTVAQLADGLLFISEFSRQRFNFRFSPDRAIPQVVTHLTLTPEEIGPIAAGKSPVEGPYLLLFGNGLDHKCVAPTLETLRDAFPFLRIVVIGGEDPKVAGIAFFRSGQISEADINGLVARATAIVYPSFYEGFGLPVVHGLAHGRTVIVRRSPLWEEISALSGGPGQLVQFHDLTGLIEGVGRALHPEPQLATAYRAALEDENKPPSWSTCSRRIADLIDRLSSKADTGRWLRREVLLGRVA